MSDYFQFLLLGLGTGAVYAGLSLGVVLAYQGSGVINFAHGAMAMYVAFVYDELRDTGDYVLPVIGLPARIAAADGGLAFAPAFALAMGTAALLGYLVHVLVFNPLRRAPMLAKVVAAVGLMLVLRAIVELRFDTNRIVDGVLPDERAEILGVVIARDRLWLALVVLVVTAVLWMLYRLTRFGLATRAAADQEKGAIVIGYSPSRLAAYNWVLASVVAGLVGILAAPITTVNSSNYVLFIVPAMACALVGRLRSLPVAAAAGLALGMVESVIVLKVTTWSIYPDWLPAEAARRGLPFLVIIVFLYVSGDSLPTRGSFTSTGQARALMPRRIGLTTAVLVPLGLLAVPLADSQLRFNLYITLASSIILLSVVLLTGYVGQVSLAQAVFAGAAGFGMAKIAAEGVGFPLSLLAGSLIASLVGVLMAIPALRIRGAQLAVVTMAAGVVVEEFVFKNPIFTGDAGVQQVDDPTLFGVDLAANHPQDFNRWEFGVLLVVVLALTAIGVANIRRSATGRRFLALRSNEVAAAAVGIDVTRTKLLAFGLSSFVAGVGGGMLAYMRGAISSDSFSVFVSLTLLAFAYLGGIASVSGALIGGTLVSGGIVFALLDEFVFSDGASRYALLIGGVALILTAIMNPEGISGKIAESTRERAPTDAAEVRT